MILVLKVVQLICLASIYIHSLCKYTKSYLLQIRCQRILRSTLINLLSILSHKSSNYRKITIFACDCCRYCHFLSVRKEAQPTTKGILCQIEVFGRGVIKEGDSE